MLVLSVYKSSEICYNIYVTKIRRTYILDIETIAIQLEQVLQELAEQYDSAAENELLWALGAPDAEQTRMHTENVVQNRTTAVMYRKMAEQAKTLVETYAEDYYAG